MLPSCSPSSDVPSPPLEFWGSKSLSIEKELLKAWPLETNLTWEATGKHF